MSNNSNSSDSSTTGSDKSMPVLSQLGGSAVQIAKICDRSFEVNEKALANILLSDRIRDLPVVVVSIAGDLRKGKSFLLNFFIRYLQSNCATDQDWIGRTSDRPLNGFVWRGGSIRETTGIWIWSIPFIIRRTDGRDVAVILMDTQGTWDSEDTVKDSANIFALTLLTSSIFVYNLHHHIQENNLDHLHLFSDFGILALSSSVKVKPFQKLVFLIRDWAFISEYPLGETGGKQYLKRYMTPRENNRPNKMVREFIDSAFEEQTCFLLPHPGKQVATSHMFNGVISQIDEEFVEYVEKFVPNIISKDKLIIKKIGGSEVTGHTLYQYFSTYGKKFASKELPQPMTMLEATAEANNLIAVATALNHYIHSMEKICGGDRHYMNPNELLAQHNIYKQQSVDKFNRTPRMGGHDYSRKHSENLIKEINESFVRFNAQNESKDWLRLIRTPGYVLLGCFLSFFLHYVFYATGFQQVSHFFFIISTVFVGVFVLQVVHIREGLNYKSFEFISIVILSTIFSLFLLYWRFIFGFFSRWTSS